MEQLVNRTISIQYFCLSFESLYNFEIDEDMIEENLRIKLRRICEMVCRYSPYEDEIEKYGCCFSGNEIVNTVGDTLKKLNTNFRDE